MRIAFNDFMSLEIDDDNLSTWSFDRITGIYTFNFIDGATWKFESELKKFYQI